jgi:UDP-N-acetylmuramate--alanine ligase
LGIDFNTYKESIKNFKTVDRRLQLKYNQGGVKVYDDYAHHPVEIRSSLSGLKESGQNKIISIFQPHLFSRTKDFYIEFAKELSIADEVILIDIYPARETPIAGVTSEMIYNELVKLNSNASYIKEWNEVITKLLGDAKQGTTIVFQGAGDITILCDEFVKKLQAKQS